MPNVRSSSLVKLHIVAKTKTIPIEISKARVDFCWNKKNAFNGFDACVHFPARGKITLNRCQERKTKTD